MINDFSEYSDISVEDIQISITKYRENIMVLSKDFIENSQDMIYENMKLNFNIDQQMMITKFQLFSPYMLSLVINSGYTDILDMSGLGLLSSLIKKSDSRINVTYSNINKYINKFVKWRFDKYNEDINVIDIDNFNINYDVIISDGYLSYFGQDGQSIILSKMIERVNRNGILCLLADITDQESETRVDIIKLQSLLEQSDMVCIYGKNTFSSLWKKMI